MPSRTWTASARRWVRSRSTTTAPRTARTWARSTRRCSRRTCGAWCWTATSSPATSGTTPTSSRTRRSRATSTPCSPGRPSTTRSTTWAPPSRRSVTSTSPRAPALAKSPAGGVVGGDELDDTYLVAGYIDLGAYWPYLANALSKYKAGDSSALVDGVQHARRDAGRQRLRRLQRGAVQRRPVADRTGTSGASTTGSSTPGLQVRDLGQRLVQRSVRDLAGQGRASRSTWATPRAFRRCCSSRRPTTPRRRSPVAWR